LRHRILLLASLRVGGPKIGFSPRRGNTLPNYMFIWAEMWEFIWAEMWEYSPQKLSKFLILAINLPLMGDSFAQFL